MYPVFHLCTSYIVSISCTCRSLQIQNLDDVNQTKNNNRYDPKMVI